MRETFTSIAENIGEYIIEGSGVVIRVIDVPGHERLRGRFFEQYKTTAKGLIFVIDSVTVQKDIRDVAEYVSPTIQKKINYLMNEFFILNCKFNYFQLFVYNIG